MSTAYKREMLKQLEENCKEPVKSPNILFWTSEVYGMGTEIRKFACYPINWPLNLYGAHGTTQAENPAPNELEATAPAIFFTAPRLVRRYKELSSKTCFCLMSPFVFFRRRNHIEQSKEAKGTVVFVAHTTPLIDDVSNMNDYIAQLNQLPETYKPLTICLHYHDINKGLHLKFIEAGFNVVTVGHPYRKDFIATFYNIVRKHQFATSNDVGSYLFYCVEMGIPFFLFGNEPVYINKGDQNIEKGEYTSYKKTSQMAKTKALFSEPVSSVTPEQKRFVEEELGVYDSISRFRFSLILYSTYMIYLKNIYTLKMKIKIKKAVWFLFKG